MARRWRPTDFALGALLAAVLTGCSSLTSLGALDDTEEALTDAGYADVFVGSSSSASSPSSWLNVWVDPPPGRSFEAAVQETQRIVWNNHPEPFTGLMVVIDGRLKVEASMYDLSKVFGSRVPVLERIRND